MRSRRNAALGVAGALLVALLATAVLASTDRAFTIGVLSSVPSGEIRKGQTACQKPIRVPPGGGFDKVDIEVGTYYRRGPALDIVVRSLEGPRLVRRGVLAAGYPDVGIQQRQVIEVGDVPDGAVVEVCVRNRGPNRIALFGGSDGQSTLSSGYLDGTPIGFDYDVVLRGDRRSFAMLVPDMAARASLFRPPWVSPALYYVLAALVLLGLPLLLLRALRSLDRDA